jgi:tetratricopeptide (TPR) repeat protein
VRSSERHQLKQDRLAATTAETITWASEHRRKIINIAAFAGIALIAVAGVFWFLRHREQQASAGLAAALEIYNAPIRPEGMPENPQVKSFASDQERAKASVEAFKPLVEKYSSSRSGQMARYFLGLSLQDLGNNAEAEKELKGAAGSRNSDVASMSKFALASLYRNTNRTTDAINSYKDLAEHPSVTVPKATAQLELASLYESTQQKQEAAKLYEQIAKDNPQSVAGQIATAKRQQLQTPTK